MRLKDLSETEKQVIFKNIDNHFSSMQVEWVKYVDLGCKVVRIVSYSKEFLSMAEKQLTYTLKDSASHYDTTLVIWHSDDIINFCKKLSPIFNAKTNLKLRIELLSSKSTEYEIRLSDSEFSKIKPLLNYDVKKGIFSAYNYKNNTYYYVVKDLNPEEFIKEGHIFVQFFNEALKSSNSNLVHGASIGLNGNGILFCARGQRGKSTLSVLSMMKGFEYVSDDYLTIYTDKNNNLLASPIYSIITLSPEMYNRLYDYMPNSRFISNNARKDKYVFNISNFHSQFRTNYPVKMAIFPEIVTDNKPSIRLCTSEEKGRAITHIIQSTLMQTKDLCEAKTVKKIFNMIKNLPFYKFDLCHDIDLNTEFLRNFLNNFEKQDKTVIQTSRLLEDITFDLANIIDTEDGIVYSMNKFATNVYENLKRGVSLESLKNYLRPYSEYNINLERQLDLFEQVLSNINIHIVPIQTAQSPILNKDFMRVNNYNLSFKKYSENDGCIELLRVEEKDKNVELQVK